MEPLLRAMEAVVDDLFGHVHRVAAVAVDLGRQLGLSDTDLERLSAVGTLHDVGKIHVDPAIIAKPGPLNPSEQAHMRRHPELGFAMIVDHVDREVADAILLHHERWDGRGYPYGLAGEEIPLLSRIVLVADAFDAITSHRSYQPALPVEHAISEIRTNSGSQFDPLVVGAFLDLVAAGRFEVMATPVDTRAAS